MQRLDRGPCLDHLGHALVTDDQVIVIRWRRAVLEGGDFPIGAADPDVEDARQDLVGADELGRVRFDDVDVPRFRKRCDRFHATSLAIGTEPVSYPARGWRGERASVGACAASDWGDEGVIVANTVDSCEESCRSGAARPDRDVGSSVLSL